MKTKLMFVLSLMILALASTNVYAANTCNSAQKPSYTDCTVYLGWIPFDDYDCDCKADFQDNCEFVWNSNQEDSNSDGVGDLCATPGNNPPTINSCSASQTITQGQTATINYAVSDPDGDSITVTVNWGDGTITTGGSSSASHVYTSTGTFSVTVTASDSKGATSTRSCGTITVSSLSCVAPTGLSPSSTITISGDTGNIDLSWNAVPDAASYNVRLDDGTSERFNDARFETCPNSPHYYCENGISGTRITNVPVKAGRTYTFWIDPIFTPGRNYCNGITELNVVKIETTNHPPAISSCSPQSSSITVGGIAVINYGVSDPDNDAVTITVNWGDGTITTGGSSSASHVYSVQGVYSLIIVVTDSRGATTSRTCGSITVTSANKPPVVISCGPSRFQLNLGEQAIVNYQVSDPDGDVVVTTIDWGDGQTSTGSSSSVSHVYSTTGTFTITITATDSKGASSTRACGTISVLSTTNNAPVISSCSAPSSVSVGSSATISYSVSDPDNDAVTITVNWGDGTTSTGGTSSASHIYSTTGTFSVTITATDSKGASSSKACGTIGVTTLVNKPPVISSCSPSTPSVKVGDAAIVSYIVSDPNNDLVTVAIDWGDGSSSAGGQNSASHVYNAPETYSVIITATDSRGASTSKSCGTIKVSSVPNNPPVISSCSMPSTVRAGDSATITYSVSDTDGDAVTITVNWGDGSTTTGGSSSASHIYSAPGTYSVTIIATDGRAATTSRFCGTIVVLPAQPNNAPVISSCSPANLSITLGSTAIINYQISDPDNDAVTITVNWGDGSTTIGSSSSASHVYTSTGAFSVTITATDSKGASSTRACGTISVLSTTNNAPVISSCSAPSSVSVGLSATISYSVSDPDNDAVTITVNWGDGSSTTGGTSSASHTYSSTGTFTVTITAIDSKGASSSRTCGTIIVASTTLTPTSKCPKIKITDADAKVDGRSDNNLKDNDDINKKAAPGSRVELKVTIENLYNKSEDNDLQDVRVTAIIEGIDNGDDLEEESNEFDLNPQDDKKVTFRFHIPSNAEEGDYDINIDAEGDDEKRLCSSHEDDISLSLEVEKEKHKLIFSRLSLNKAAINCSESFALSYDITNLGQEDEVAAYVEIRNDDLGLNFVQKDISVGAGTENNKVSKSHTLKVSGNADGNYPLAINLYSDDGKLQGSESLNIELRNCPTTPEEKIKEEKVAAQQQISTIQVTGTDIIEQTYPSSTISGLFIGSNKNLLLLVLSTFILSIFFLFVAIVAFVEAEED